MPLPPTAEVRTCTRVHTFMQCTYIHVYVHSCSAGCQSSGWGPPADDALPQQAAMPCGSNVGSDYRRSKHGRLHAPPPLPPPPSPLPVLPQELAQQAAARPAVFGELARRCGCRAGVQAWVQVQAQARAGTPGGPGCSKAVLRGSREPAAGGRTLCLVLQLALQAAPQWTHKRSTAATATAAPARMTASILCALL